MHVLTELQLYYLLTLVHQIVVFTVNSRIYTNLKKKGAAFDAAGASEGKMTAVSTHQCELILGRHQVGKHTFVLLDLSHINETLQSQGAKKIDGIIGADFLIKHKASIDYRTRKLSL